MIPANLIDWVKGHIDFANKGIQGPLIKLARAHSDAEVEAELMKAIYALNRASNILEDRQKTNPDRGTPSHPDAEIDEGPYGV